MIHRVKAYVAKHRLIQPGDRLSIAVSAGADSVALLRIMLELRDDLGVVLSIAHFNHKIRSNASDADEQFVLHLAQHYGLDFHSSSADVPAHAARTRQSLETAARELRYKFFNELLASHKIHQVATAHTMDDQAETVLMRLVRGAGTRGLAGIYPVKEAAVIRPLLEFRRSELRQFLEAIQQPWREDATNADLHHTRNSIRHELLPLLAEKYNPAIVETLARTADVARAEEEYWSRECDRLLPLILLPGKPVRGGGRGGAPEEKASFGLSLEPLVRQPQALQRRLLRTAASSLEISLDIHHVAEAMELLNSPAKACELPGGWRIQKGLRELRFEKSPTATGKVAKLLRQNESSSYEYSLPVPGDLAVPEINSVVHARLLPFPKRDQGYNQALSQGSSGIVTVHGPELKLRNWRAGDRFRPANTGSEKKVKELLQDLKVHQPGRKLWPVVAAGEQVIWVQGTRPRDICLERDGMKHSLIIEVEPANASAETKRGSRIDEIGR